MLNRFDKLVDDEFGSASALMSAPANFCSAAAAAMIKPERQPKVDKYKDETINLARFVKKVRDCGVLKQAMATKLRKAL